MNKVKYILLISLFVFAVKPVLAQTSTDTPVASPSAIQEQIKERIKNVVQEKLKSTEENLENKAASGIIVGYQGVVTDIAENSLTLLSDKTNYQISVSSGSAIIKNGKTIKPDQISIKDTIIVIGNSIANEVINAKRIVLVTDNTPSPQRQVIFAPIAKINTKSQSLAVTYKGKNQVLVLDKKLKLDLTTLKMGQMLFGLIQMPDNPTDPATLLVTNLSN